MYIEDMFGEGRQELFNLFNNELEHRLKHNTIYTYYKELEEDIVEFNMSDNEFFIMDLFIYLNRDELNGWEISFSEGDVSNGHNGLTLMLESLKKDNELKSLIAEYKEIISVIKQIITDNSNYDHIISDEVDGYFKRSELLFSLKEKIHSDRNIASYWGSINDYVLLYIPTYDVKLCILDQYVENMSIGPYGHITLPYSSYKKNEELLKMYIEEINIFNLLKNIKLQQTFSEKEEPLTLVDFDDHLTYETKEVFEKFQDKQINYAEKFLETYTKDELYEIYYSSVVIAVPAGSLSLPSLSNINPRFAKVIKTERGVYYLDSDRNSIRFQTLNDTYID